MPATFTLKRVSVSNIARAAYAAALLVILNACGADVPSSAANGSAQPPQAVATARTAAATRDTSAVPVAAPASIAAFQLEPAKIDLIVKTMLADAYGPQSFDAAKGCWSYQFNSPNGELDYCMKADAPKVVGTASGVQIYLQTRSDPDADIYSLVDPGLRGLFAANVAADGSWRPLATSPAIDQGQSGDCGCQSAELIQVGPELRGWLSTSGGTWQGITVVQDDLQVPLEGSFRNVLRIPQPNETGNSETIQIRVDSQGAPVSGFYPIRVTRTRNGQGTTETVVAFDPAMKSYPLAH